MSFPDKKYNIIYADPPWSFGSKAYQDSGRPFDELENHYNTMSIDEIKKLDVPSADDCTCFMWTTDAHLKEAIEVMESWGFKYKTIAFIWVKKYESGSLVYNFAPYTLKSCEICILGTKGTMGKYKKMNNVKQLVEAVRTKHSKKPDEVRKRIDMLYGNIPRIELFAREKADGWDSWGNEIPVETDNIITDVKIEEQKETKICELCGVDYTGMTYEQHETRPFHQGRLL